jgi:hypothetical protein
VNDTPQARSVPAYPGEYPRRSGLTNDNRKPEVSSVLDVQGDLQ